MWWKLPAHRTGLLGGLLRVRRALSRIGRTRAWDWLALVLLVLALAGCPPPNNSSSVSQAPTVVVPPNYSGSLRITFSSSTAYEQAVAIVQGAGMELVGPDCIGRGANPGPGVPPPLPPDEHDLYGQRHILIGGTHVTQAMANKIAASPQVTALELIHIPLCA